MVHAGPRGQSRALIQATALVSLFTCLQLLAVLNPAVVEVDPEEGYNAGHAFALANGHWDALFTLQYRPFCGGCTLNAALGASLFSLLPPSWLVWKLVPISFSLLLLLGFFRLQGPARWIWATQLLLPLHAWLSLSLIGWGNHYEAGALAAAGLLLLHQPRRPLAAGLSLGAAIWVGFSGLFALPAALLWLLFHDRRNLPWLLLGVGMGLTPWLGQWLLSDTTPFGLIYGTSSAPLALDAIPGQVRTLAHPRQLAGLLGHPMLSVWGAGVLVSMLTGLLLAARSSWGQLLLLSVLSWMSAYLLSGFHIPIPAPPSLPTPASLRYMAPLLPLLMLSLAVSGGALWSSDRRVAAAVLLAGPLLVGMITRASVLGAPFPVPEAATMLGPDLRQFRLQASYMLDWSAHRACQSPDPRERAVHGYALGYTRARRAFEGNPTPAYALMGFQPPMHVDEPAFYEGAAVTLIDHVDSDGKGDISVLAEALQISSRWGMDVSRAMLWTRRYAPWLDVVNGHDSASL